MLSKLMGTNDRYAKIGKTSQEIDNFGDITEGGNEDYFALRKNSGSKKRLEEACIQLFELPKRTNRVSLNESYFRKHSRDKYQDLIAQLRLCIDANGLGNDLDQQFQRATEIDNDTKEQQIYDHFSDPRMTKYIQELNKFRNKMADIFSLLDQNQDFTLYKHEYGFQTFQDLLEQKVPLILNEEQENTDKIWFDKWKSLERVQYHDIQMIVWYCKIKHNLQVEWMRDEIYKRYVPCSQLQYACRCLCKLPRSFKTKNRYKKKEPLLDQYMSINVVLNFLGNLFHALDLYSDGYLALLLYIQSRQEFAQPSHSVNQDAHIMDNVYQNATTNDYSIAFIIVVMAITGPYIIQYSSLMSTYQNKGIFKSIKDEYSFFRKAQIYLSFTFFGLITMPCLDLFVKIESLLKVLSLPLQGKKDSKNQNRSIRFQIKMRQCIKDMMMLNSFELQNFEKQKQYTQVLFEDLVMLLLQVLIFFDIVQISNLQSKNNLIKNSMQSNALMLSFVTTIISLLKTAFSLWIEGKALQERLVKYIMLSVNARINWVPFGQKLMNLDMNKDINFSDIQIEMPLISKLFAIYPAFTYVFSDESFKTLSLQIQGAIEKQKVAKLSSQDSFMPKIKFGFSVYDITIHDFCSMLEANYTRNAEFNKLHLDLSDIDWSQMIENSRNKKLDFKNPATLHEKSLIKVCIENFDSQSGTKYLLDLMELLLQQKELILDISQQQNENTLLSYCCEKRNLSAYCLLLKHVKNSSQNSMEGIDINRTDKMGTTLYGRLIKQSETNYQDYHQYIKLLFDEFDHEIDINKPQVLDQYSLPISPYYYKCKYIDSQIEYKTAQDVYDSKIFKDLFVCKEQFIRSNGFLQLIVDKSYKDDQLVLEDIENLESKKWPMENLELVQDIRGNNVLHIFNLKIRDIKYMIDKETLTQLLKQKNYQNQDPIQKHLKGPKESFHYQNFSYLLSEGLVQESKYDNCDQQVIEDFTEFLIQKFSNDESLDYNEIDPEIFFGIFKDPIQARDSFRKSFEQKEMMKVFKYFFKGAQPDNSSDNQNSQTGEQSGQKTKNENDLKLTKSNQDSKNSDITEDKRIVPSPSTWHEKPDAYKYIILETYLNGFIEWASTLDFISDWFVLLQLSKTEHTIWFSFSLFTMLCPYYTVFSSLITFNLYQISCMSSFNLKQNIGWLLLVTPVILIILFMLDIALMIIYSIFYLIMFIIIGSSFGQKLHGHFDRLINRLFMNLFGMSVMNYRSFKSQRTILQIQLESLPQIVFQVYLLWRIPQLYQNSAENSAYKIDSGVIFVSVIMALAHILLEFVNLKLEARITQTRLIDYLVSCYNARQGWIPFEQKLLKPFSDSKPDENKIMLHTTSAEKCGVGFTAEFELSEFSLNQLTKIFSELSILQDGQQRKLLILGNMNERIKLSTIFDLIKLGHQKMHIEFVDNVLKEKIKEDQIVNNLINKQKQNDPLSYQSNPLVSMIQMNQPQVVQELFEIGLDLNEEQVKESLDQAFTNEQYQLIKVLVNKIFKDQSINGVDKFVQEKLIYFNSRYFDSHSFYISLLFLLDPKMIVSWDTASNFLSSKITSENFKEFPDQLKQSMLVLFGNHFPTVREKIYTSMKPAIEKYNSWIAAYPDKFKLFNEYDVNSKYIELDSSFLSQFVVIRRALYMNSVDFIETKQDVVIDLTEELGKIECSLNDIEIVNKIIKRDFITEGKLSVEQAQRCDRVITHLGFDKFWSYYYHNSRKVLDQTYESCHDLASTMNQFNMIALKIELKENVRAVKELRIYKKNQDDKPEYLSVILFMKHNLTSSHHVYLEQFNGSQFESDSNIQHVFYFQPKDDPNLIYQEPLVNLIIFNNATAGHTLQIMLQGQNNEVLDCWAQVTTYDKFE